MPQRLTIQKVFQGESWVNVYWFSLADIDAVADGPAAEVVAQERLFHHTNILFTGYRVDDGLENTDSYYSVPLNVFGQRANATDALPLFNTIRVDFSKLGGGRPGRKYYRGCLEEGVVGPNGVIAAAFVTAVQGYTQTIAGINGLGSRDFTYVDAAVAPFVAMRQLRRGSKKNSAPLSGTPA